MAKEKRSKVVTEKFRVSFANVFKPVENMQGKMKYSIVMLFDNDVDLTPLKVILKEAAAAKWGNKLPKDLKLPFRDGNEKEYDGYKDKIFMSASSTSKPGIVDEKVQPILNAEEFYSGCYARATLTAFAYDVKGNRGVTFGLQNLQKLNDGEPFSGKSKAEDDFGAIDKGDASDVENSDLFGGSGLNQL